MSNFDEVDRRILHELQTDARRSNKALAETAGISASTMLGRVRSLEERSIITGYHAEVRPEAIGRHVQALVSVRLHPKTPTAVQEFIDAIWALDEVVAVTLLSGQFDAQVHLGVSDVASLGQSVLTTIAEAPHVVDEQTSIVFRHQRKTVLQPLEPDTP